MVFLNRSAEEAFKPLMAYKPYVPFRDASCGVSTFHLTVFDVIKVRLTAARGTAGAQAICETCGSFAKAPQGATLGTCFSVQGIQKARDVGFIDWNSGSSTWSAEEYEHYEQVGRPADPCMLECERMHGRTQEVHSSNADVQLPVACSKVSAT